MASLAEDGDCGDDLDVLGISALLDDHALRGLQGEAGVEGGAQLAGSGGADQRVLGAGRAVNLEMRSDVELSITWRTSIDATFDVYAQFIAGVGE